jgi:outer membrane protein assembly factor BamE (lipoprotein component of BamABCDE complex)
VEDRIFISAPEARLSHRPAISQSRLFRAASVATLVLVLAGCASQSGSTRRLGDISTTTQHGYVVSPFALEQVPVGSSMDQVLIALGSPSTKANYGNEVFYYISQTRHRSANFLPEKVIDQNIVAVYFNDANEVQKLANYTLQDGIVVDTISRTTPTGGADQGFVVQMFAGMLGSSK